MFYLNITFKKVYHESKNNYKNLWHYCNGPFNKLFVKSKSFFVALDCLWIDYIFLLFFYPQIPLFKIIRWFILSFSLTVISSQWLFEIRAVLTSTEDKVTWDVFPAVSGGRTWWPICAEKNPRSQQSTFNCHTAIKWYEI